MSHSLGFQQLTVSTSALGLTVPAGASRALIRVSGANGVTFRDDGTDPTAAIGFPIVSTDPFLLYDGELTKIKFIRTGASDGLLNVSYYN